MHFPLSGVSGGGGLHTFWLQRGAPPHSHQRTTWREWGGGVNLGAELRGERCGLSYGVRRVFGERFVNITCRSPDLHAGVIPSGLGHCL